VTALAAERLPPLIGESLKDTRLASRNYLLLIICARAATATLPDSKLCKTWMCSATEGVGKGFAALVPPQISHRQGSRSGRQQTGSRG